MLEASIPFAITVLIILCGYLIKRIGLVKDADGKVLSRIVINFTLPCLILSKVETIKVSGETFLLIGLGLLSGVCLQIISALVTKGKPTEFRGAYSLCLSGYNIGLLAYPIAEMLWGDAGLSYLIMFDLGNGIVLFGLNYVMASRYATSKIPSFKEIVKTLFRSVPFITYILVIILASFKVQYPQFISELLGTIASGNTVMSLLLLGITLTFAFSKKEMKVMLQILGVRYGFGLLAACAIMLLAPFPMVEKMALVMAVLLPISVSAVSYTIEYNFDVKLVSAVNNLSTLISLSVIWILIGIVFPLIGVTV